MMFSQKPGEKIAFVPGGSFYPNGNKENTLRINYSNMPEDKIEKGLKTLGEVVKEYISQSNDSLIMFPKTCKRSSMKALHC